MAGVARGRVWLAGRVGLAGRDVARGGMWGAGLKTDLGKVSRVKQAW